MIDVGNRTRITDLPPVPARLEGVAVQARVTVVSEEEVWFRPARPCDHDVLTLCVRIQAEIGSLPDELRGKVFDVLDSRHLQWLRLEIGGDAWNVFVTEVHTNAHGTRVCVAGTRGTPHMANSCEEKP